jgi:hypothetical protein
MRILESHPEKYSVEEVVVLSSIVMPSKAEGREDLGQFDLIPVRKKASPSCILA